MVLGVLNILAQHRSPETDVEIDAHDLLTWSWVEPSISEGCEICLRAPGGHFPASEQRMDDAGPVTRRENERVVGW